VRRLPEGARQVVILSLSGLGAAEIGEVLGITENNAAVRLSRARRALKDLL
jgi:DNA-directed RNA polymerase specialized sigma24 family protein